MWLGERTKIPKGAGKKKREPSSVPVARKPGLRQGVAQEQEHGEEEEDGEHNSEEV